MIVHTNKHQNRQTEDYNFIYIYLDKGFNEWIKEK